MDSRLSLVVTVHVSGILDNGEGIYLLNVL